MIKIAKSTKTFSLEGDIIDKITEYKLNNNLSSDSAALERIILSMNTQPNENSISYNKKIENIECLVVELLTRQESIMNEKTFEKIEPVIKEEPKKRGRTVAEVYGIKVDTTEERTPDEEVKKSYIPKLKIGFGNR